MYQETLAVQPTTHEQFDRNKRDYDDLTTLFAEMVEGSMRTPFEFTFDGRELYARDGSPMGPEFDKGLADAERTAAIRPGLRFEVRRRRADRAEYDDMIAMAQGRLPNTMVVVCDFPEELMDAAEDVGGYNVRRKMAMLRVLAWDGRRMKMYSQTLDLSDRQGLEAIFHSLGYEPPAGELMGQRMHRDFDPAEQDFLVNKLMGVYDRELEKRFGGQRYAGRQETGRLNTYDFVRAQHDIIQYAMVEKRQGTLNVYRVAALLEERYQANGRLSPGAVFDRYADPFHDLNRELSEATWRARSVGRIFSACGMTVEAEAEPGLKDQLKEAGYGNKTDSDTDCTYISKSCPMCGERNVRTSDKKLAGRRRIIKGSCGCSKVYSKPFRTAGSAALAA